MIQKILLVDDREDNLVSIEAILQNESYRFFRASSGREALKILLRQFDFSLILMDVEMPDLNGFDTAQLIYGREKLRNIPIIFITAHSFGDEQVFKGYRSGGVDYIYKPINPQLLRTKVSVFTELYSKNQQLIAQEEKLKQMNMTLAAEVRERTASEEKAKELNRQLFEKIAELELANRELDRFAFMASHDLQEPLRKIRAFSDWLSRKYGTLLEEDGLNYIQRIQKAAQRMQTLISDLLMFSKFSASNDSDEECDLNRLMKDITDEIHHDIVSKNAVLNIGNLPVLNANAGLMRPLFSNLINNALKYSKNDVPPVISISSSSPRVGDTLYHRILIEDNGIGFDQSYSEKIFGMFQRLHTQSEYEGTGIGLALCKRIVEQHGGFITARSEVNKGSTFIVSFPVREKIAPLLGQISTENLN